MRFFNLPVVALVLLAGIVPASAGQDGSGLRLTGTVGGTLGVGDVAVSVSAGAGYRVSKTIAIDAEFGYLPSLDWEGLRSLGPGQGLALGPATGSPDPIPAYQFNFISRLLTFMTTVSLERPIGSPRVRLFGIGGAGVASLHEGLGVSFGAAGVPSYDIRETSPLVAAGAGVDVDVWMGLAVGGEVRYFHVFGERRALDVTRVSARLGWQFD